MGYAGATYLIQEFCNGLFDALFHILPLGTEMDKVDSTLARGQAANAFLWDSDAQTMVANYVQKQPVLVQISAAKQLRDRVERDTESSGEAPAVLRAKVTSKGGTTAAALASLEQDQFMTIVTKALQAARDRGHDLSNEFK